MSPKNRAISAVEQTSASRMNGPARPQGAPAASGSIGVAWPKPGIVTSSTRVRPSAPTKVARTAGPTGSSASTTASTPCTSVHCSTSSVAFGGSTVPSASPCQIETRGHGPANPGGAAARTRAPQSAAVRFGAGLCGPNDSVTPQAAGAVKVELPQR